MPGLGHARRAARRGAHGSRTIRAARWTRDRRGRARAAASPTSTVSSSPCFGEQVTVSRTCSGSCAASSSPAPNGRISKRDGHCDRRRPVGVEALDRLHAPELAAGALAGRPRDRLEVGVEDEVAAGRHLDPVAAGLEAVEEEPLRDAVLRRRGLDRRRRCRRRGRPRAGTPRACPPRRRGGGGGRARRSGRRRRSARARRSRGSARRPARCRRPARSARRAGSRGAPGELAARADVGGEDVDVVEPLHARRRGRCSAAAGSAMTASGARARRSARPRSRARRRWPSGSSKRYAGPCPTSPSIQPRPRPVSSIAATRRSSASGLQARSATWPRPACRRLGQLQAVAQVVAPAAQVDRLPLARLLLHPEHVDEEAQALLRLRREQLGVADAGDVVERSVTPPPAPAGRPGRRRARPPGASPACRPRARRGRAAAASTSSTRSCSTTATPSASRTTSVALADRRAADDDRLADRARHLLVGAA